jgi:bifunctional DNA-binding transcriptional regulator/antitoxin component of YhaV-PrlF toxin-antitoxin module
MATPIGPRKLTTVRQVAVPARLLRELGLVPGDEVYFSLSEGWPKRILIIPGSEVSDGQEKVGG